ncbi:probable fructokinase-7 isoform X2 [Magnolia sinica]|uniref:probable fructokinase-7 isoform X2 n=1 Tax=Magnolia sinica TaxID=86752 RepID=UPI0026593C0F|nr:probable fructokinase-7 isoform X2 [Magnolia sinica]
MANSTPGFSKALLDNSRDQRESSLVVCFGEMLIDFVPTVGGESLAEAPAFKKAPGGAPANVAVGISRLGGSSAFIGKVGQDAFGYMLAEVLKENNVDNSGMRFDPVARTALAFVTLRADGEREFLFFRNPSADMLFRQSELDIDLIKKVSEEEIRFLTEGDDPYDDDVIFKKLFHPNLKLLVISEGSEGCRYYTKQFKGRVGAIKVKAVDTTGAGDAFVSGILSILVSDPDLLKDEKKLREALWFANVCGALTVTEKGAIPALPTRDAVLRALPKVVA